MTFNYTTATPTFTSLSGKITALNAKSVSGGTSGSSSLVKAKRPTLTHRALVCDSAANFKVLTAGSTYLIYSLRGAVTLCTDRSAAPTVLTGQQKISGVLRVAKLGAAAHESALATYSATYATGMSLDYSFSTTSANLVFTWSIVGDASKLLMLTWPHHRCVLA